MATKDEREYSFYPDPSGPTGKKLYAIGCPGCNRIEPQPQALEVVYNDGLFSVHQDYEIPLPYFWVIQSARHFQYFSDIRARELKSLNLAWRTLERAMRDGCGIQQITAFQQNKSSHFHLCLMPELPWMKDDIPGYHQRNIQTTMSWAIDNLKNPKGIEAVEEATQKMKSFLKTP